VRCPRCGNENPGTNRFCGMCGATLLPPPAISTEQHAAAQAPTAVSPLPPRPAPTPPAPSPRRTSEPRAVAATPEREPVISGPSFLGLNQPASNQNASNERSAEPRRASLRADPHAASGSRNLDYLLEDDEPRSGGIGKFILIVVALLLVVGLGYLRWKNQGLGWLGKSASKPPAATDSADSADSNAPASSTGGANSNSSSPAAPNSAPTNASPSGSAPVSAPSGSSQPAANQPPAADSASSPTPPVGNAANSSPSSAAPGSNASPPSADATPATDNMKDPNAASADTAPAPAAKTKPAAPKPAPKPTKSDPVTEAKKYLYGKGAKQDCERGMRLLKPEADRSNPKAMTEMGALYSAGLCTPHDLPTAYRWFALALRKDPDNQELQGDLQKLWGEMTQPERQQAIRLSQ
jgi:hypothetical protein